MNGLNDSHKRTSISQLLNPASREAPSYASSLASVQSQQPAPPFSPESYQQSFHLRAASWDQVQGDPSRRSGNGTPSSRVPHSMNQVNAYEEHPPRVQRSRSDDPHPFTMDNAVQVWGPPHQIAHLASVVASSYPDGRIAMPGDYPPHNYYSQGYQDPIVLNPSASWQRAPIRPGARGMAEEQRPPARYGMQPQFFAEPNVTFGIIPFQPPAQPQKRPASDDVEGSPAPKVRKGKTKTKTAADGTTSSSKRGYNAKKRSEAAQIAAQNAQWMPTVSYTQVTGERGKEKTADAPMRMVSDSAQSSTSQQVALRPELQFARCMSNRYRSEQFPRCVSCTRRWAGDTCRFQGIRFFLKDAKRNTVGISFVETDKPDAPTINFPNKWNVPLQPSYIRRTKRTTAEALLPILRQELVHLGMAEIIRRPRESEVRATCDTCMTSIFARSWMCRLCGREACAECFELVKELTDAGPTDVAEMAALQVRREKHSHTNPFFLACTRRNEHQAKDFSPMSRFCNTELTQVIKDMEALLREPDPDALPTVNVIDPSLDAHDAVAENGTSPLTSSSTTVLELTSPNGSTRESAGVGSHLDSPLAKPGLSQDPTSVSLNPRESMGEVPSLPTKRFTNTELTDDVFRPIWARGEPLVVTGLLDKFRIKWTPEYFIAKYSSQPCLVIECQTDANKRFTVGEFFSLFGKYENRTECWKLKDWPPSTDFRISFPDLYEDFNNAVPVPNYVRRDGALNIASHFPPNAMAPDLGPKMHNSMLSFQSRGSKGSMRLHMDMADTLNIMTFASPSPDGSPGCAAWDLFRAEDSDKLRQFLRKRCSVSPQHDPIHSQQFYLDCDMRKDLYEMYGVKSHRVYQEPGDAILIPAGCAHQVSNMADCIKVAVDFVSPENIAQCEKLIREFREQNQSMGWKEDVLQLRTMMWFAWLSCCRQER